ncbi:MAG: hypothetical protein M3010_13195, partial [Candidatus Dormibacteraeota bacterium]|nr:hypothetical protein [Candidatus Dormibacteraeota bacterium]
MPTEREMAPPDHAFRHVPVPLRTAAAAAALRLADATKWCSLRSYPLFQAAATAPIPGWAEPLGARAALRAALHAHQHVPAYRDFVATAGWTDDRSLTGTERLARLPVMD